MSNYPKGPATFTRVPIQIRATSVITFAISVPCRRESWVGMLHTPDLEIQAHRALKHVDECGNCQSDQPREATPEGIGS